MSGMAQILDYQKHTVTADAPKSREVIVKFSYVSDRITSKFPINYCIVIYHVICSAGGDKSYLKLNFDAMHDIGIAAFNQTLGEGQVIDFEREISELSQKFGSLLTPQDHDWTKRHNSKKANSSKLYVLELPQAVQHDFDLILTRKNKSELSSLLADIVCKFLDKREIGGKTYMIPNLVLEMPKSEEAPAPDEEFAPQAEPAQAPGQIPLPPQRSATSEKRVSDFLAMKITFARKILDLDYKEFRRLADDLEMGIADENLVI